MSSDDEIAEIRPTIDGLRPTIQGSSDLRPTLPPGAGEDEVRRTIDAAALSSGEISPILRPTLPGDTIRPTIGESTRPTLPPTLDESTLRPTISGDDVVRLTISGDDGSALRPTISGDALRPTIDGHVVRPTIDGDALRPTFAGDLPPLASDMRPSHGGATTSSQSADDSADEKNGTKSSAVSFVRRRSRKESTMSVGGEVFDMQTRPGMSTRQVQELRDVFGLFDMDGVGKVAPSFVRTEAVKARLDKDNPEVWSMLDSLEDMDEPVDFAEFLRLITEPLGDPFSKAGAQDMMRLFNAGDSCHLGLDDLTRVIGEMGIEMSEEDLKDMLDQAGADAEDQLDLDTFYDVVKPAGASDSDGDSDPGSD